MSRILGNKNYQALLLLACLVIAYRFKLIENLVGLSTASVQYFLVIPVLFAFSRISIETLRIPKKVLILAGVASIFMGMAHLKLHSTDSNNLKVIFAPFKADDSQVQSIKFQDLLKKELLKYEVNFSNLANPVENAAAAGRFFSEDNHNSVLLAGTPRWLTVYFSERKPAIQSPLYKDLNLKLVNQIRSVSFSDALSLSSRNFISLVIRAQEALARNDMEAAEVLLADAASVYGAWTTPNHRAYPLWLAGTLHLESVKGIPSDSKKINCALNYFNRARKLIHDKSNNELLSALLNNRGIAYYLSSMQPGKKKAKRIALKDLKKASKLAAKKTDISLYATVKENNWYMNQSAKKAKKFKKKKKNFKKNKKHALVSEIKNS